MTERRGTSFREARIVRGECEKCAAQDELLYDADYDPTLMCAPCARVRAYANPRKESCDNCGAEPAWRDPKGRKSIFLCAVCHGRTGAVFVNRWAPSVRESVPLATRAREICSVAEYDEGADRCRGQVRPRGKLGILCDFHFDPKRYEFE